MSYFTFKNGETPLNDTNLNNMQDAIKEDISTSASLRAKLIYNKVTTEEDAEGFDITDITLKDGKMYKISVDGSLQGTYGDSVNNLKMEFNDIEPTLCRNWVFGSEAGSIINTYSLTNYLRALRGFNGFGCHGETEICYRNGYIRAISDFAGYGNSNETSVNTKVTTMLGQYSGDITKIKVSTSDPEGRIDTGSIIKIFELP